MVDYWVQATGKTVTTYLYSQQLKHLQEALKQEENCLTAIKIPGLM